MIKTEGSLLIPNALVALDTSGFVFSEKDLAGDGDGDDVNILEFVNRMRMAWPLAHLQSDLKKYLEYLQAELYEVINRDYKDFISIATKLDGVDDRVEQLRSPLIDLRIDLSNLHGGVKAAMQAIQDKLQAKAATSRRRAVLEHSIASTDYLSSIDKILSRTGDDSDGDGKLRLCLISRRDILHSLARTTSSQQQQRRDRQSEFACSELERAAALAIKASSSLAAMERLIKSSGGTFDVANPEPVQVLVGKRASASDRIAHPTLNPVAADAQTKQNLNLARVQESLKARVLAAVEGVTKAAQTQLETMLNSFDLQQSISLESIENNSTDRSASNITNTYNSNGNNGSSGGSGCSKISSSSNNSGSDNNTNTNNYNSNDNPFFTPIIHCLRALTLLGQGDAACSTFASTVVLPLIRSYLTQGRLDGKGGRGSFSGLLLALTTVIGAIRRCFGPLLHETEQLFFGPFALQHLITPSNSDADISGGEKNEKNHSISPLDLTVYGIFRPIIVYLYEKFPGIFQVAVAGTFVNGFKSCQSMIDGICRLPLTGLDERDVTYSAALKRIYDRLYASDAFHKDFFAKWKLAVYFTTRAREIKTDIEKVFFSCHQYGFVSGLAQAANALNQPTAAFGPLTPAAKKPLLDRLVASSRPSPSSSTISMPWQLSFTTFVALALMSCFHEDVVLSPLRSDFLLMTSKIVVRTQVFISIMCDLGQGYTPTPDAFEMVHKAAILAAQQALVSALTPPTPSPSTTSTTTGAIATINIPAQGRDKDLPPSTPVKKTASAVGAAPMAGGSGPTTGQSVGPPPSPNPNSNSGPSSLLYVLNVDELALFCADMHALSSWIRKDLLGYAQAQMSTTVDDNSSSSSDNVSHVLQNTLTTAAGSIDAMVCNAMLAKLASLLLHDCRRHLAAVKVIAAKYRMTNKPPPDAHSSYVDIVNGPIKSFRDRFKDVVGNILNAAGGVEREKAFYFDLLEEVAMSFLQQVQSLMDTVKTMDSALQRRSKLASVAGSGGANQSMTDSDKIALQVSLDVQAFGQDVTSLNCIDDVHELPSYNVLLGFVVKN